MNVRYFHSERMFVFGWRLILVAFVAIFIGSWFYFRPHRNHRSAQLDRFAFLALGLNERAVIDVVGSPDLRCTGGDAVVSLRTNIPGERLQFWEGEKEKRLRTATKEVVVYFFPEKTGLDRQGFCGPAYLDTAIGLDASGRVIWFTILLGEDSVTCHDC